MEESKNTDCVECRDVVERTDVPHVIRKCRGCGREMHILSPGEHGRGIQVLEGDQFVIPDEWLQIAMNPLQSTGRLLRGGMDAMAQTLFLEGLYRDETQFADAAANLEKQTDDIVAAFEPVAGLDVNQEVGDEQIRSILNDHANTKAYWAYWTGKFLAVARDARASGAVNRAMWATACAERFRAMLVYKTNLEEVVWMGQSVKRILNILATWDSNQDNGDEEFWQLTFNENSYVLSQVFAVPLVFIQDKAYVGGMKLDRSESRFVDYVFSAESSREAILIEIKTPNTTLMGSEYRGVRPPSRDLAGSVVQALNYRHELVTNLRSLPDASVSLSAFNPKCAVIVGNAKGQLNDHGSRRSFELFRAGLKDVEIITYDELFRKVEILAELFGLVRAKSSPKLA